MKKFVFVISVLIHIQYISGQSDYHVLINQHLYEGKYDTAIAIIESVNSKDSCNYLLSYQLGKAHLGLNNYKEALTAFISSYNCDTSFVPSIREIGQLYDYMGQSKKSISKYRLILELEPGNHQMMNELGRIYRNNGYYIEAIQTYLNLIQQFPENYYYHKCLGECYLKKNNDSEATKYFQTAHSLNSQDLEVILRLGNLSIKSGDYVSGIRITNAGLMIDSVNIPALKLNGYLHMLNENSDSAILRLSKCLELNDSSFFIMKYLGLSYYQKDEYDSALVCLGNAAAIDSTDIENYFYYATALGKALYKKESIKAFEKLLVLLEPPTDLVVDIYTALAENHDYLTHHQDAFKYELMLIELDHNPIWILRVAAHYDYTLHEGNKAVEYYRDFINAMGEESDNPYVKVAEDRITKIREEKFFQGEVK